MLCNFVRYFSSACKVLNKLDTQKRGNYISAIASSQDCYAKLERCIAGFFIIFYTGTIIFYKRQISEPSKFKTLKYPVKCPWFIVGITLHCFLIPCGNDSMINHWHNLQTSLKQNLVNIVGLPHLHPCPLHPPPLITDFFFATSNMIISDLSYTTYDVFAS